MDATSGQALDIHMGATAASTSRRISDISGRTVSSMHGLTATPRKSSITSAMTLSAVLWMPTGGANIVAVSIRTTWSRLRAERMSVGGSPAVPCGIRSATVSSRSASRDTSSLMRTPTSIHAESVNAVYVCERHHCDTALETVLRSTRRSVRPVFMSSTQSSRARTAGCRSRRSGPMAVTACAATASMIVSESAARGSR